MAQWKLTDNSTGTPVVFSFPLNPKSFDPPGYAANITQEQTTSPAGNTVLMLGRMQPANGTFSGIIHTASFFSDAQTWFTKWYPMVLTDDQGNTWNIVITSYQPTRLKRAINRWRYDYTVDFMEVG